jgi:4'-phosphopantetheinyl transferase
MTEVYWLEQVDTDVPAENDWLSENEAAILNGLRFAKRRTDWRLGRWTAKRALAVHLSLPSHPQALAHLEIRPAPSGAPEAFLADLPAGVTISLSHRAGIALCSIAPSGTVLGCDLEMIEPRSDAFVADYFTTEEQELVARTPTSERPCLLALLWSGKESALKALREGLRLDTRCVTVTLVGTLRRSSQQGAQNWYPLRVDYGDIQVFHGWWQQADNMVRTVLATPPPAPPTLLTMHDDYARSPLQIG